MTAMTAQIVERYVETFEGPADAGRHQPRRHRKLRGHGGRRRNVPLSAIGRSHRRSTFKCMMHGQV